MAVGVCGRTGDFITTSFAVFVSDNPAYSNCRRLVDAQPKICTALPVSRHACVINEDGPLPAGASLSRAGTYEGSQRGKEGVARSHQLLSLLDRRGLASSEGRT